MFCLFKSSHLVPKVNIFISAVAWIAVLAWLNFTFVEKELVFKVIGGEAIMVDLLLGIPLVLMLAVVVYATIYWFFKLIIVYLFPRAILPASEYDNQSALLEDPELERALQEQYGENYWQHRDDLPPLDTQLEQEHADRTEQKAELQNETENQTKTDRNRT